MISFRLISFVISVYYKLILSNKQRLKTNLQAIQKYTMRNHEILPWLAHSGAATVFQNKSPCGAVAVLQNRISAIHVLYSFII